LADFIGFYSAADDEKLSIGANIANNDVQEDHTILSIISAARI
jgi:hypothetical protein